MYRAYLLSLLWAARISRDGPAGAGFLYDKADELGETKERSRVYIRNTLFSIFAVCSVSCSIFSVFICYVLLQGFVPYLGPFYFISLIHLSHAFRGFVLSGFKNSRGLPNNKICYSDPSVDRIIEIVGQLEQVYEPYRKVLKEMKGKISNFYDNETEILITNKCTPLLHI